MRPLLAEIPALPAAYLPVLAGLVLLAGVVTAAYMIKASSRSTPVGDSGGAMAVASTPLLIAAALIAMLFVWSRNPIRLHSYGFFLVLGFFLATWNACLEARRRGYDPNIILDMAMPMLLATVAMCRVLYVLLNLDEFTSLGQMVRIWDGGLSFHGALIAAPLVVAYFARSRHIGFGTLCDIIAPSVFLGYIFGRFGCFMNGCCYGGVCDLPWAVQFHAEGRPAGELTPPSHPAQLYSSLMALGLFFFMQRAKLSPVFTRFPGQLTLLFFALYAIERGIMEIFRAGATAHTVLGTGWLTQAQVASLIALVVIAVAWTIMSRRAHTRSSTLVSHS